MELMSVSCLVYHRPFLPAFEAMERASARFGLFSLRI